LERDFYFQCTIQTDSHQRNKNRPTHVKQVSPGVSPTVCLQICRMEFRWVFLYELPVMRTWEILYFKLSYYCQFRTALRPWVCKFVTIGRRPGFILCLFWILMRFILWAR
jgi:hypothetical protein